MSDPTRAEQLREHEGKLALTILNYGIENKISVEEMAYILSTIVSKQLCRVFARRKWK